MTVNLIISAVLAVLLLGMIFSAWRLDRNLKALRDGDGELKALIDALNKSTESAQSSIVQLKAAAKDFEQDWGATVGKARELADELQLITHSGENLAERLTQELTAAPAKRARQAIQDKEEGAEVVRALRGVR